MESKEEAHHQAEARGAGHHLTCAASLAWGTVRGTQPWCS